MEPYFSSRDCKGLNNIAMIGLIKAEIMGLQDTDL